MMIDSPEAAEDCSLTKRGSDLQTAARSSLIATPATAAQVVASIQSLAKSHCARGA
jgi:hypothetical protein